MADGIRDLLIMVRARWDAAAEVWVARSDDVPGLATEAPTLDILEEKLRELIPLLLEENGMLGDPSPPEIPFHVVADFLSKARISQAAH